MAKFKCWYDYAGQETEGQRVTQEPVIIEAEDVAEAMWIWHHKSLRDWGDRFYGGDIEKWRKEGQHTGWGCWCKKV